MQLLYIVVYFMLFFLSFSQLKVIICFVKLSVMNKEEYYSKSLVFVSNPS